MKDTEKSALFIIIGIAAIVVGFIYVMKPNWEDTQALKQESEQLQMRLNELQQKQAKRDEYLAGIDEFNAAFDKVMANFPADLNQEVTIMFLQGIKDDNDFDISSLNLGEPEQFYTLGLNGGAASLGTADAPEAAAGDETAEDATAEEAAEESAPLTEGAPTPSDSAYVCYRADFPISYTGSYESLKAVINYVNNFSSRMTINSLDIAYEAEDDIYSGNIDLKCYSIENAERAKSNLELNNVEIGVDNIFNGGSGVGSSSSSSGLNKYDENDGAAIESNYDFYAMLNPSTSDVSAKVVGQNGTGKEASVISNSDNGVSTLSYEFYEKDGKVYCKYTLDNSTSYEAEVTSAEDIKLLIQSSARKDADDKVGVRVTISNETDLPVYVKVSGDDSTSPRVEIARRSGSVKVY